MLVSDFAPVEARCLGGDEPTDDDDYDEKDSSGTDAAWRKAIALRLLMLDQLDDSPQDQQQRPVVRKPRSQPRPGEQVQVAQQEDDSKHDQNERSGERTPWRRGGRGGGTGG